MAKRVNQHLNPLIGTNIKRLRKERNMKMEQIFGKENVLPVKVEGHRI